MPEPLPPRITSAIDQYQCEAREQLALDVTRYHERGWTLIDQVAEYVDEDPNWLMIMLATAIDELRGLSRAMGLLDPKGAENA